MQVQVLLLAPFKCYDDGNRYTSEAQTFGLVDSNSTHNTKHAYNVKRFIRVTRDLGIQEVCKTTAFG